MTTEELLAAAAEAAPEKMEKTAEMMLLLERISPEHEIELRQQMSDILSYTNTKFASAAGYGPVTRWGAAVGGTILAGLATSAATDLYDAAKRGLTKGRNFKQIMKVNPDLKHVEKGRLMNSYDALHRYAPEFTADPILGGTLLKAVAEVPGNEHVVIKDLINARKNLQDAKHTQFQPGKTEFDLPSSADIAAEAAQRAHQVQMEERRQGHNIEMAAASARLKADEDARRVRVDVAKLRLDRELERPKGLRASQSAFDTAVSNYQKNAR